MAQERTQSPWMVQIFESDRIDIGNIRLQSIGSVTKSDIAACVNIYM